MVIHVAEMMSAAMLLLTRPFTINSRTTGTDETPTKSLYVMVDRMRGVRPGAHLIPKVPIFWVLFLPRCFNFWHSELSFPTRLEVRGNTCLIDYDGSA